MAALQNRNGSYRVLFEYQRKQRVLTLGRVSEAEAKAKVDQIDYLLMRLKQGLNELPPGIGIVEFVQNDGKSVARDTNLTKQPTLVSLRDRYLATHGNGTLEAHTLRGINRHFKHLVRELGGGFPIGKLSLADLQGYVDKRTKAKGKRGTLLPTTIKKEIVTLRTAWNWGVRMKIVTGRYPYEGLRYPKSDEKPPFQNRDEIERQIPGLTAAKADELWDSLYLRLEEIERLLAHVKAHARHPWIYPLVATAAHTGARKGELLKMRIGDVDFAAGVVSIQERKRAHGRRTTRRVPLSTALAGILKEWLVIHPGGTLLFAPEEEVINSKKRSLTTGYLKDRPTSEEERLARVKSRKRPGILPLTEDEAHYHFKQALKGSEWEVVRGIHVLRHGFVSACASKGVDLRMLQEWCGHMSPEIQRRYLHLYPSVQAVALKSVFG